jgi:hypothetical protein
MSYPRHLIVFQAATPIAHGDTVTGIDNPTNTRLFMRQQMLLDGKPARVPAISENALRSVLFRGPLADDLVTRLGIQRGELPQAVMNLLWSGGSMASGAKAPGDEIALGHQVKALYPMLDLLGGAVDGFILPRSRLRLAAWIVAREYAPMLRHVAPELVDEAMVVSAYDMVGEETRTRGTGGESEGNQMLYTYETLAAGAKIVLEVTLDPHTPEATASALGAALKRWDGYIGGQGRQGRGRLAVLFCDVPASGAYEAHCTEHADRLRAGLVEGTLGTAKVLCARK